MKQCVYTALFGDYEKLNDQPLAKESSVPFVCLTDNPNLKSNSWIVKYCKPLLKLDSVRSQRAVKILPHRYLPEFKSSIYIDNTVKLTQLPEFVFDRCFSSGGFSVFHHSHRKSVIDEFYEVATTRLDRTSRLLSQLNFYLLNSRTVILEKPFWNGILIREHHCTIVREIMELWFSQVLSYSRRDQLSLNYSLLRYGFAPYTIEFDNFLSPFHTWPHCTERKEEKRFFSSDSKYFEELPLLLEIIRSLE